MQTVSHFLYDSSTCSVYLNAPSKCNTTSSYCDTNFWLCMTMNQRNGTSTRETREVEKKMQLWFSLLYPCVFLQEDHGGPVWGLNTICWDLASVRKEPWIWNLSLIKQTTLPCVKKFIQYLQSTIIFLACILLNVPDSCYLYFYVYYPTVVSGALGCTLMLSLMSKCRVDSGKIQRDTVITAYVAKE